MVLLHGPGFINRHKSKSKTKLSGEAGLPENTVEPVLVLCWVSVAEYCGASV